MAGRGLVGGIIGNDPPIRVRRLSNVFNTSMSCLEKYVSSLLRSPASSLIPKTGLHTTCVFFSWCYALKIPWDDFGDLPRSGTRLLLAAGVPTPDCPSHRGK